MTPVAAAFVGLSALCWTVAALPVNAQSIDAKTKFVRVANGYRLASNITYLRAGGVELKLDVYQPRGSAAPTPTLMYIHGGGWTNGNKESSALTFLPYLEMGWAVVNVEYRMADDAHAPAATLAPLIFLVILLYQISPVSNGSGSPATVRIVWPRIALYSAMDYLSFNSQPWVLSVNTNVKAALSVATVKSSVDA